MRRLFSFCRGTATHFSRHCTDFLIGSNRKVVGCSACCCSISWDLFRLLRWLVVSIYLTSTCSFVLAPTHRSSQPPYFSRRYFALVHVGQGRSNLFTGRYN